MIDQLNLPGNEQRSVLTSLNSHFSHWIRFLSKDKDDREKTVIAFVRFSQADGVVAGHDSKLSVGGAMHLRTYWSPFAKAIDVG